MCPTLLYWVYDAVLQIVESKFPDFKIPVMKESEDKNHVSKPTVIVGVLLQQFGQAMIAGLLFLLIGPTTLGHTATVDHQKTVMAPLRATVQFLFTLLFLYKFTHSCYHRLVALYAYGVLYNHPLEELLVDTMSGARNIFYSLHNPMSNNFTFSLATITAVDNHSGMWIPWHPFHLLSRNNNHYTTPSNMPCTWSYFWFRLTNTFIAYQVHDKKKYKIKV
ncbi:unnamed protein product [Malus baccata var. baccata]